MWGVVTRSWGGHERVSTISQPDHHHPLASKCVMIYRDIAHTCSDSPISTTRLPKLGGPSLVMRCAAAHILPMAIITCERQCRMLHSLANSIASEAERAESC